MASLQRLAYRRGGALHHARPEACAVLLQCEAGMEPDVATLLAGWLHWHGRLPLQEACLAAEVAMDATVDTVSARMPAARMPAACMPFRMLQYKLRPVMLHAGMG